MAAPPSGKIFRIFCKAFQKATAYTTSDSCAPISFSNVPAGGSFGQWTWTTRSGGPSNVGMFTNGGNPGYATARDGKVVVCPQAQLGSNDQIVWELVDNHDGTFLVQIPQSKLIWGVDSNSNLVITDAQKGTGASQQFAFA
ncbi:hypothetical protein NP233_g2786 [Leucocoprinus birnbaumii]|uniref:Uncharacterized protein n=1 Tax=Leucocoprinus birnbaumii TaxID=56174 RepID=A0AAD5W403_9AGAR|nr:hypothetical protein NP233_g2786 [Leucocoprinus birnbaumii]